MWKEIGKADTFSETPEDTARREAYEEIGLPLPSHNFVLPVLAPTSDQYSGMRTEKQHVRFSITRLTELPCSLSRNNLAVRPVVAVLLPTQNDSTISKATPEELDLHNLSDLDVPADLESILIPRLDPKEVSAVFSVPLEAFLKKIHAKGYTHPPTPTDEQWYKGRHQNWYGRDWYMHEFMAPVWAHKTVTATKGAARVGYNDKLVTPEEAIALANEKEKEESKEEEKENVLLHYRVWGMTARILIDTARIAYEREPDFECSKEHGDEDMIAALYENGMLKEERQHGEEYVVQKMFQRGNL